MRARRPHLVVERLARSAGRVGGLVERLAPGHLLHQERRRHRGVALGVDRRAAQFAQVGAAAQRVLQALVGLVDAHRPLHRHALGGRALSRRSGRGAPRPAARASAVERRAVRARAARQVEQREVVVVELHRPCVEDRQAVVGVAAEGRARR
jgi:hypothetical protein